MQPMMKPLPSGRLNPISYASLHTTGTLPTASSYTPLPSRRQVPPSSTGRCLLRASCPRLSLRQQTHHAAASAAGASDASSSASFEERYRLTTADTGHPDASAIPPLDASLSHTVSASSTSSSSSSSFTGGATEPAVVALAAAANGSSSQRGRVASASAGAAAVAHAAPGQFISHRWRIVWMMAAAFVLCNMDKVNMSVAVIPMARELQWTATERGFVSSSFFWGYSLTQIPAGWVSTKIGGARVLMAGVALWSFGTLLAPPAAQISIYALCASRMLVGLGEGFAPSAATAVMAATVPPTERARAVTTVFGGLDVGSAVGLLVSGPLIARYGWPSVFYLFAVLGVVWCVLWPLFKPDKEDQVMQDLDARGEAAFPERCSLDSLEDAGVSAAAAAAVSTTTDPHAAAPSAVPPVDMPWGSFFSCPAVWAVTVAHFCFNWGYYTLLAWLPSYFELALGLDVKQSSFLTLIPYVAMAAMTPFVGPIADGMAQRGVPLTRVRKICQGIAFAGPALCMVACGMLTPQRFAAAGQGAPVGLLVGLLSVGFALGAWSRAGLYCNHQDLSPKYAGALLGITNTAGALPGVLGVTAAGMLLDATNSWSSAIFYPTAVCQLIGLAVYSVFASSERQDWK